MSQHWPPADLRLVEGDLTLRPFAEADLPRLVELLPDDVELDPAATSYDGLSTAQNRAAVVQQDYWRALGGWRPESWTLRFAVLLDGVLVGHQGLEGEDFLRRRTVDSSSFLVPEVRGRGLGVRMRAVVLTLAFGPLAAEYAVTSAWHDNGASLGVSRSLGYADNGCTRDPRGAGADEMVHLRLTRAAWLASGRGAGVELSGVEPCLPYFGLPVPGAGEPRLA